MSVLNWNGGNLGRNSSLLDFICGNWMLVLLQEASTTLGQSLAGSRGICWSDAPDGHQGKMAVLAGASGEKTVTPTYGLDFTGEILRPYKDKGYHEINGRWYRNKCERLGAAYIYTVDVEWKNETGELVKRAGLESWRVTTFHMNNYEAKTGAEGSGGTTLAAAFGLAMRDRHRVFSADFNQAHHYVRSTLDNLISTKREYSGITYQYLGSPYGPEIGTVIFNYPGTVQLIGEEKADSFADDSPFWQYLGLSDSDKDAHYPQVLYIYDKDVVGDLGRRQLLHQRSAEGTRNQKKKRDRAKASNSEEHASMKAAKADDDVHPNSEDANISAHAEMSWYEPLVASNCSFVDEDRDIAAAVALGEAQDGIGQKLINAAGEITEEAQRE